MSESVRVRNIQSVQESSRSFMNVTSSKFSMVHLAVFNVSLVFHQMFQLPYAETLKKKQNAVTKIRGGLPKSKSVAKEP